ncbi:MAG: cysteine--tRNA ligase, partial [Methylococcaceae bacterium]
FTVREVLKQYQPEIIRFFILSSHYRSPLNYSDEQLNDARLALMRLYTALRGCNGKNADIDEAYKARFEAAMDDDFNTPVALSVLFDLARELNAAKEAKSEKIHDLVATLRFLGGLLGIVQGDADDFLKSGVVNDVDINVDLIEQQIQSRLVAKKAKDWSLADKIRDDLKEQGIILEDTPNGLSTWRRE